MATLTTTSYETFSYFKTIGRLNLYYSSTNQAYNTIIVVLVVKWTLIDIHNSQYCHLLGRWPVSFLCSLSIWWSKIILMYVVWLHSYRKYYNMLHTICPVNFIFLFKNLLPLSSKPLLYVTLVLPQCFSFLCYTNIT